MEDLLRSPFIFERPLPPADLVDRETETAQLVGAARGGRFVRIVAPRRYGKTSLLRKVLAEARDKHNMMCVLVDFSGAVSINDVVVKIERAYAEQLRGKFRDRLQQRLEAVELGLSLGPVSVAARLGNSSFNAIAALETILEVPMQMLAERKQRGVVVFDEFQEVLRIDRVDGLMRSKIQHHGESTAYFFCGSEPGMMHELFEVKARPLYGQAVPYRLGRLADGDVSEYIHRKFAESGKQSGDIVAALVKFAEGHPQRMMLLADMLWQLTERNEPANESTWLDALEQALRSLDREFRELWQHLDSNEECALRIVLRSPGCELDGASLRQLDADKPTTRNAIQQLIDRGVLETDEQESTRFVDPLFKRWLERRA